MDLLKVRRVYHRANSDDPQSQNMTEMMSVDSRYDNKKGNELVYDSVSVAESTSRHINDRHSRFYDQDQAPLLQTCTTARWFSGWRTGAYSAACISLVSLIINIAAAIWLRRHPNADSNLVEVFNGSCDTVSQMDIWVHLLINAISTLLLGGSNYCMQCLCAPTRPEIDKAHAKGHFLDIAVPSYHNLVHIAWSRRILWWILGLSSLPLHLMYNSAFYSSLSANDYDIVFVTPEFLKGGNATYSYSDDYGYYHNLQQQIASNTTYKFERLDPLGCIQSYSKVLLADRRNLVFVLKNNTAVLNSTVIDVQSYSFGNSVAPGVYTPFDWICNSDPNMNSTYVGALVECDTYVARIETMASQWSPWGHQIDYCLSEIVEEHCSFNGNLPVVYVVIVANAVKVLIMLFVAYCLAGSPLITLGDALESFLNDPDEFTKDICYITRAQAAQYVKLNTEGPRNIDAPLLKDWKPGKWRGVSKIDEEGRFKRLVPMRWSKAASTRRWTLTIGSIVAAIATVAAFLAESIWSINGSAASILELGFGTLHPLAIIYGWSIEQIANPAYQILASILIANLPQAILSFLYLNLNGLLTSMFTALEWSHFATQRKPLRVSTPKGQQRSTYFLQLPYKIAFPLMIASSILHWLVSRSIFLAVVSEYSQTGKLVSPTHIATCGFSPMAMLMVIAFGVLIIAGCFTIGLFKYNPSMPVAGSCSVVISAACHRPDWDLDASIWPVQWGVIPHSADATGVGHCSFTSGPVEPVQEGKEYAGVAHG